MLIQQLLSVCNEVLNDGSSDNITVMHNSDECCYCQMKFFYLFIVVLYFVLSVNVCWKRIPYVTRLVLLVVILTLLQVISLI